MGFSLRGQLSAHLAVLALAALLAGFSPGLVAQPIPGQWTPLAGFQRWQGGDHGVFDLLRFDPDGAGPIPESLYIGGWFQRVGGQEAHNLARFDGSTWWHIGNGVGGPVNTLAAFDDGSGPALFVGGEFDKAAGVPASNIAKWDGKQWTSLGGGTNGPVYDLAVFNDGTGDALYAAGVFQIAGGIAAVGIARWNGSEWSEVGEGLYGGFFGRRIAVVRDEAGEAMYLSGTNWIRRWDGAGWQSLDDVHIDGGNRPLSLHPFDPDEGGPSKESLFVGGFFDYMFLDGDSVPVRSAVRWDGDAWFATAGLGTKYCCAPNDCFVSTGIRAFAAFDDGSHRRLYAAGVLSPEEDPTAASETLARWDGSRWRLAAANPPGVELATLLSSMADGGETLIGGGCKESWPFLGRFTIGSMLPGLIGFDPPAFDGSTDGTPLSGQRGWTSKPGYQDLLVYPYAANPTGFPVNLDGGEQFASTEPAGQGKASLLNNTVNLAAADRWSLSFDFAARFEGPMPEAPDLARVVLHVQADPGLRLMMDWDDPTLRNAWTLRLDAYDAGGKRRIFVLGPGASNLVVNHWYRVRTVADLATNRIAAIELEDLGSHEAHLFKSNEWHLLGGAGGQLPRVTSVRLATADGLYAVGGPGNLTAWDSLRIEPAPCKADCDADGANSFFDYLCFANRFAANDPLADCNGDDILDFFDFLCFVNEFEAGC